MPATGFDARAFRMLLHQMLSPNSTRHSSLRKHLVVELYFSVGFEPSVTDEIHCLVDVLPGDLVI